MQRRASACHTLEIGRTDLISGQGVSTRPRASLPCSPLKSKCFLCLTAGFPDPPRSSDRSFGILKCRAQPRRPRGHTLGTIHTQRIEPCRDRPSGRCRLRACRASPKTRELPEDLRSIVRFEQLISNGLAFLPNPTRQLIRPGGLENELVVYIIIIYEGGCRFSTAAMQGFPMTNKTPSPAKHNRQTPRP